MAFDFFGTVDMLAGNTANIIGALNGGGGDYMAGRLRDNRINGSGPNDPDAADAYAPRSLFDFILGRRRDSGGNVMQGVPWGLILAGGLILVGWFLWRRK